jgi:hypothetical protein
MEFALPISGPGTTAGLSWEIDIAGNISTKGTLVVEPTNAATSGTVSAFTLQPTYNQATGTAANTDFLLNRIQTQVGSGEQLLMDLQVSGTSQFSVSNTGDLTILGSITTPDIIAPNGTAETPLETLLTSPFIVGGDFSLGVKFTVNQDGYITHLAFYSTDTASHTVRLWNSSGVQIASATATGVGGNVWQRIAITPVAVTTSWYIVSYRSGSGNFPYKGGLSGTTTGSITINEGRYSAATDAMPATTSLDCYGADVTFVPSTTTVAGNLAATGVLQADAVVAATINGSNAANGDLVIQGTSNTSNTTSYVHIQPNGGVTTVGSTPATPVGTLHVNEASGNGRNPMIAITQGGNAAGLKIYEVNGSGTCFIDTTYENHNYAALTFRVRTDNSPQTALTLATLGGLANVGIAGASPTARLHLPAGTSATNTAPLKFTSGTLTTSAAAGQFEFLTDKIYFTVTTGAARKEIMLADTTMVSGGRIPYTTTNGRLNLTSALAFNGSALIVPSLWADSQMVMTNGNGRLTALELVCPDVRIKPFARVMLGPATGADTSSGTIGGSWNYDGYTNIYGTVDDNGSGFFLYSRIMWDGILLEVGDVAFLNEGSVSDGLYKVTDIGADGAAGAEASGYDNGWTITDGGFGLLTNSESINGQGVSITFDNSLSAGQVVADGNFTYRFNTSGDDNTDISNITNEIVTESINTYGIGGFYVNYDGSGGSSPVGNCNLTMTGGVNFNEGSPYILERHHNMYDGYGQFLGAMISVGPEGTVVSHRNTQWVATAPNDPTLGFGVGGSQPLFQQLGVQPYQSATLASGSATSLVTATAKTVISVSLSAGDWDVWGVVAFKAASGTTTTYMQAGTSSSNNTMGADGSYASLPLAISGNTVDTHLPAPATRYTLTDTTTIYLIAKAAFGVSTMTAFGTIKARKINN